ncbi:hypothetical protein [Rubrolithibacter danxiaensis]|uniref:hypothetical protein n=1 Tax=Rubrolithibacter danxiaensis TaxID=3390805 RepID=UPI003BF80C2B
MKKFYPILKKLQLLFLISSLLFFTSCSQEDQEADPSCAAVLCAANLLALNIKYVDKTTNKALLNNQDSLYKIKDLKVIEDNSNSTYKASVNVDSSDKHVAKITELAQDYFDLKLGTLPSDKVEVRAKTTSSSCCPGIIVTKLSVNDSTICEPCNDLDKKVIEIRK